MADNPYLTSRTWRDIAEELSREPDHSKLIQLAEELNQALLDEELRKERHLQPAPARIATR